MKIIREVELTPNFFSFYLESDYLHVESLEKDEEGKTKSLPDVQYLQLDNFAKKLINDLEQWIKTNLK